MMKQKLAAGSLALTAILAFSACGAQSAASSQAASPDSGAASSADPAASATIQPINYGAGLDARGYWEGVTALDYVTLPADFENHLVPDGVVSVSEDEVADQLSSLLYRFTTTEKDYDKVIESGDRVNIDYIGSVDGVEFEGGNTHGAGTTVTAGTMQYIDDFLFQIIGHKPGETINVEVTFPEQYGNEQLNGKDAVFVTTINYVEKTIEPELNDEFVASNLKELYNASTVDELTEAIRNDLAMDAVIDYISAPDGFQTLCTFSEKLPDNLYEYEKEICVDFYQNYATQFGLTMDEFLSQYVGVNNVDELLTKMSDSIEAQVKNELLMQAIAEAKGISCSDTEAEEFMTGNGYDFNNMVSVYGMNYIKNYVLFQKASQFIADNAIWSLN